MKSKKWMPKAFVLGAVFYIAIFFVKPIGVSTQYSVLSGIIHSTFLPNVITVDEERESGYKSSNAYYDNNDGKLARSIKNPWNYDFVFVLAIPLGSFITSQIVKRRKPKDELINMDLAHLKRHSHSKSEIVKVYIRNFIGGFLLLYGARMADGCTSGHMMSGMMQGAISGYVFAAAVFAVAIPTAVIVGLIKQRRRGRS